MEKDKEPQMDINNENYYSKEADMEYMSASQFKGFMKCEARQKAILTGEYVPEETTALLQGRLLETLLLEPDKIEQFREENSELFSQRGANKGELKSEFKKVQEMADRAKQDNFFISYLGDPFSTLYQYPVTGEIAGIKFKGLLDIYQPQSCIVDLKGIKDFQPIWDNSINKKLNFIEYWGYHTQLAVYQWLVKQNTGEILPVFIAGITKETVSDIGIFSIPQEILDHQLSVIGELAPRYQKIKDGRIEPVRCECCDYCKATKELNTVVNLFDY